MDKKIKDLVGKIKKDTAKEAIKIKLKSSAKVSLISSVLGGMFYLPKDKEIPVNDRGEQLLFLAQINCEELPENSTYPKSGIMSKQQLKDLSGLSSATMAKLSKRIC